MAVKVQYLDVYLKGVFAGKLTSENAVLSFQYDEAYLQSEKVVKLSASLPLQHEVLEHDVVYPYFSGLLPDEDVRKRLARYLGVSDKNTFGLLKEIGGECAGAVSVYPEGVSPASKATHDYRVLEEDEAADILTSLDKKPLMAGEDDIRISGAGAQDKLVIAFVDGKIAIPKGNTPSTHIIKPAIKDINDSVFNEYFCMRLAAEIGLPVPEVSILWIKGTPYYVIKRYDRVLVDGEITRLHQEDFCQAMHIAPEIKYEDEGGPSLLDCFNLIDGRIKEGAMPGKAKLTLLQGVLFNYLIGNGDAHGKNFSLLYDGESEDLAPFYDLLCTVVYNNHFKAKMAMKINKKYRFRDVTLSSLEKFAESIGIKNSLLHRQMLTLSNDVANDATQLFSELNKNPETKSDIYESILGSIARNVQKFDHFLTNR